MSLFVYYVIGYIITVIVLGVLHKRGVIDWEPSGKENDEVYRDNGLPHMVAALFWFICVPTLIFWVMLKYIYKGFNKITDYLSIININKK